PTTPVSGSHLGFRSVPSYAALALQPHALQITSRFHFHPHDLPGFHEQRHLDPRAGIQRGLFPGIVLLRVHRRRRVRNARPTTGGKCMVTARPSRNSTGILIPSRVYASASGLDTVNSSLHSE